MSPVTPRGRLVRRAVVAGAGVALVAAVVYQVPRLHLLTAKVWWLALIFLVVIAVGESWRLRAGDRETAPVALAASLAFAMTFALPGSEVRGIGGLVVLVAALGTALGVLAHPDRRGRPLGLVHDVALRVLVVTLVVVLFRFVPIGEETLREYVDGWQRREWQIAAVMLVVAGVAVAVKLALTGSVRALRQHAGLGRALLDEVGAVGPVAAVTTTTATVIALAIQPLGPVAVPLFLVPLVLLQLAVARQSRARDAQRETVRALSRLTELGGRTPVGHAARVAALAVPMGRDLGLNERELADLEYAALLHDIGQVSLTRPIPGGATTETASLDQRQIAMMGAAILSRTAELSRLSLVVAQQATPYRRIAELGDLPRPCRIIKVANAFDDLAGPDPSGPDVDAALERIRLGTGYEYDPEAVSALRRVLTRQGRLAPRARSRAGA